MMLEAEWMIQAGKCSEIKSTDGCISYPGLLLFTFSGHARLVQPTPLTHWTLSFTIIQVSRLIYQGNTPNTITTPSHTLATPPNTGHAPCHSPWVFSDWSSAWILWGVSPDSPCWSGYSSGSVPGGQSSPAARPPGAGSPSCGTHSRTGPASSTLCCPAQKQRICIKKGRKPRVL